MSDVSLFVDRIIKLKFIHILADDEITKQKVWSKKNEEYWTSVRLKKPHDDLMISGQWAVSGGNIKV